MYDFASDPTALVEQQTSAVRGVFGSGQFVLGSEVEKFEANWAKQCDFPYAVGVANGVDAIEIMLRSLDIGPGDEVITTTMSAFASVLGILKAGATPVLADTDQETGFMSLERARRCVTPSTKAVLIVHLYGQLGDMNLWAQFRAETGILLLEDCAQAQLALWEGTVARNFGRAAAPSFYPTKNLGVIGDDGVIWFSILLIAKKTSLSCGRRTGCNYSELGHNGRSDEIQAAILNSWLSWLPEFTQRRQSIGSRYSRGISYPAVSILTPPTEDEAHVYHLHVVKTSQSELFQAHLLHMETHSHTHYPVPIHVQPPTKDLKRDPRGLENSEAYAQQVLSLPCHPQMSDDDVATVVDAVNSFRGG